MCPQREIGHGLKAAWVLPVFVSVSEWQSQAWVQDWKQIEGEN